MSAPRRPSPPAHPAGAPPCPLCRAGGAQPLLRPGPRHYFHCADCDLRFLDPAQRLDPSAERTRYLQHRSGAGDPGYRAFVEPLLEWVRLSVPPGAKGLDFGCGQDPVLAGLLEQEGYAVRRYDPFFHPDPDALAQRYDFALACEVLEHLFDPAAELARLRGLLRPGGRLGALTLLCPPQLDFSRWDYARDATHVVFYSERSLSWLAAHCGFSALRCTPPRLIELRA